jgi:hypothetical protein
MPKITDANNFRRTVAGLCLIAAPLVLLLALLFHPGEGEAGLVQTVAEHPGRVEASNLLIVLSSVLFVPALIGLLRPVRGRGVILVHIGVGLALIGVIGHAVWAGFQVVLVGMVQSGVDREQLSAMVEGGPPNAGFVVVMLMFLAGFFLGMIVLAVGLWRSRVIPRWAAVCIALAPLLDFLPVDNKALFLIGPALAIIGFGAMGLKLLAMSDADREWGSAPPAGEVEIGAQPRVQ